MSDPKTTPVAVIGVGTLFPGSHDAHGFWRDILAGRDLISDVPETRWLVEDYYDSDPTIPDKTYGKRGGFIDPTDFDPMEFGIPPNVIEATDTSQLLALIVAQQVLEDAWGKQFSTIDKNRMSVILGVTAGQELMNEMASRLARPIWVKSLRELGYHEDEVQAAANKISSHYTDWQENTFPGLLGNVVAGRIANRFDFGGTNCVTDAACASALSAMSMALNELYLGHSDVVIAGGVDTFNDIFMYMCFSKTPALSATGDCRPFSKDADGTILGEGLAMFALKRLADAERDGDRIYGVIRGSGSSSDGRGKAIYAPASAGQANAIQRAYERAGYLPESVSLIEAHGTGTKAGDAAEFKGLCKAFESVDTKQNIALGSIKSQIGHTKATAGAAGFFKALMAIHHKVIPPTIKVEAPNPNLKIEATPFYLNTLARPWLNGKTPRRAGVSAFGFGGSNFHLTLEEYDGENRAPYVKSHPAELFLFSAKTPHQLIDFLETPMGIDFAAEAQKSRINYSEKAFAKLAILASSFSELKKKVNQVISEISQSEKEKDFRYQTPNGIFYRLSTTSINAENIALIFPGQGSQSVNMGREWLNSFPQMNDAWTTKLIDTDYNGKGLEDVIFPIPKFNEADKKLDEDQIRATEWAQPALGLTSIAFKALLDGVGIHATKFAGHSYGELTALWAGGALDEKSLIALSRKRGELMAEASKNEGAMSALSANIETVNELVKTYNIVVANHNGPRQVVVSGAIDAIEKFEKRLSDENIIFKRLNVATAFHSPIVKETVRPFTKYANAIKFKKLKSTVYSNTTAQAYGSEKIPALLAKQIISPVRWVEMIETMLSEDTKLFIECGPKTVLTKLTKRIVKKRASVVGLDQKGRDPWTNIWTALAQISTEGVAIDYDFFDAFESKATREKSKMQIQLTGGNYKKPYPPVGGSTALPKPNFEQAKPTFEPAYEATQSEPTQPSPQTHRSAPMSNDFKSNGNYPQHAKSAEKNRAPTEIPVPQATAPYWIVAFQESQRQMAQAHASYQHSMAQAHTAFLNVLAQSQASFATMAGMQHGIPQSFAPLPQSQFTQAAPMAPMAPRTPPLTPPLTQWSPPQINPVAPTFATSPVATSPVATSPVATSPVATSPVVTSPVVTSPVVTSPVVTSPVVTSPVVTSAMLPAVTPNYNSIPNSIAAQSAPTPQPTPQPVSRVASASRKSVEEILFDTIADKTGYPVETLDASMQLESDLGIDSIKRVEILSAITEEAPGLENVDPSEMTPIATIGGILEYLAKTAPKTIPHGKIAIPKANPTTPNRNPPISFENALLEIVAEKTGYPTEMLNLEMKLEADLGIDSIKRVEILSALSDRLPTLGDLDSSEMADLSTLGDIVSFVGSEKKH